MDDCLEFESDPEMVIAARGFVRDRLTSWEAPEHLEQALVVTSELVTNAVLHARTAIKLTVLVDSSTVRIEVFDENPRLPVAAPCPTDATSGRGLALVAAMANAWGIENHEDGKVVWAELGTSSRSDGPASGECVDLAGVDTVEAAFGRIRDHDPDHSAN